MCFVFCVLRFALGHVMLMAFRTIRLKLVHLRSCLRFYGIAPCRTEPKVPRPYGVRNRYLG